VDKVKILNYRVYKNRGYVIVDEEIKATLGAESLTMKSAYSWPDLYYIGNSVTAYRLWKKRGIVKFYPICDYEPIKELPLKNKVKKTLINGNYLQLKNGNTCLMGWSEREQKWYGWARAIWGFEIGSKVEKGNIAYKPANKEDFIEDTLRFWDFNRDGSWARPDWWGTDKQENVTNKTLDKLEIDVYDKSGGYENIGMYFEYTTYVLDDRETFQSQHFYEYPSEWGKGEWVAKTMEDAKEMARDFAEGCA
jgi:hypothetical protein